MIAIVAWVALALGTPSQPAPATVSAEDKGAIASQLATSHPAEEMHLVAMDAERGAAEFMTVCVRPMWDMAKTASAAARSDLGYAKSVESGGSGRWFSKRAYLALELAPSAASVGEGMPQCQLSLGSVQPRTSLQLVQLLKAALEAELGRDLPIRQNDDHDSYVEWTTDGNGVMNRVTVEGEDRPVRSVTYLFEQWSPHGIAYRRELRRAFLESKQK